MVNTNHFELESLPWDLKHLIVNNYLSSKDLYSLALVSQALNTLANFALYRRARLLYGLQYSFLYDSHIKPGAYTMAFGKAQDAFIRQVISHPELANQVRELEWQQKGTSDPSTGKVFADYFPLLKNVRNIHLVGAHSYHIGELHLKLPPVFPQVEHVTFSSFTGLNFAMAVLHTPSRLLSLTIDCIPTSTYLEILAWMQSADLSNLHHLTLRIFLSHSSDLFGSCRAVLQATKATVNEVHLGLVSDRRTPLKEEDKTSIYSQFQQTVLPYLMEERPKALCHLSMEGIDLDERTLISIGRVNPQLTITVLND